MNDIYFAIIPGAFVLLLIIYGICLVFGKGSILIPGYNMKAKGTDAEFFEKIYCRYIGKIVLVLAVIFSLLFTGIIVPIRWLTYASGSVGICVFLGMVIALKASKRASVSLLLAKELSKNPNGLPPEKIEEYKNEFRNRNKK